MINGGLWDVDGDPVLGAGKYIYFRCPVRSPTHVELDPLLTVELDHIPVVELHPLQAVKLNALILVS